MGSEVHKYRVTTSPDWWSNIYRRQWGKHRTILLPECRTLTKSLHSALPSNFTVSHITSGDGAEYEERGDSLYPLDLTFAPHREASGLIHESALACMVAEDITDEVFRPERKVTDTPKRQRLKLQSLKRIHVNQHVIRGNTAEISEPPLTVKVARSNYRAHEVEVLGPSVVVYRPEHPLSCGARVWIETRAIVRVRNGNVWSIAE